MKTAIITGISRGLGEALALQLLDLDYQVLGLGRSGSQRLAGRPGFRFEQRDLSRLQEVEACEPLFAAIARRPQRQVVLINNAASAAPAGPFGTLEADEIAASLQLNLTAATVLANSFCRCFAGHDADKRLLNISSGAAFSAISGSGVYCIAKAGIEMLSQAVSADKARHGVSAAAVQPGVIDTDMQRWLRQQAIEQLPTVNLFRDYHAAGELRAASDVAADIIRQYLC